jgi:NADH-quinone oxidoreductase subunit F
MNVGTGIERDEAVAFVDQLVNELGRGAEHAIPILQAIQKRYRYLHEDALRRVCELTDVTPAAITGIATFYTMFRLNPVGRHIVSVCHGTACHVKGSLMIEDSIRRHLGLSGSIDTDKDGVFTLQKVACLGCCTLAPVVQIDGVTYGHLTPDTAPNSLIDFLKLEKKGLVGGRFDENADHRAGLAEIRIGVGSCCVAGGSLKVREALMNAVRSTGAEAVVKPVGCVGMCHQTPLVEVASNGTRMGLYAKVKSGDAESIVRKHFRPKGPIGLIKNVWSSALDKMIDADEEGTPLDRYAIDVRDPKVCAFLGPQKHLATEYCGSMEPLDLDEYLAHDGFDGFTKALEDYTPEQIIEQVRLSGLRGRGGAGFPTGRKWELTRNSKAEKKYVVVNGDEGDPGAFMDRMILESYPYRVLEGLAIAAYAVGADEGVLYIRSEYPLAVKRVKEAIRRCEERGLLGTDILGKGFSLKLRIMEGAGAFVCGEETALLASIEGKRGTPRIRPPYPAVEGLWGKPTNVNNVETYALVPWIMRHGGKSFANLGTNTSKGTKVFALTGKVNRGGLVEVPMGITIRQIVEEIGGGVLEGRKFKAVQIGGPSGGCVPESLADTPIDYEALAKVGAIMGSGGLVVLDDRTCMVDMARYFLEFTQNESCGKCTFCRVGTRRLLDLLEAFCEGRAVKGDIEKLEELSHMVTQGSLCGLGQTAPNPVLTTIRYFRDEYEAHLKGKCPAGTCKNLIHYSINDRCIGCTKCAQSCPVDAIPLTPFEKHTINDELCTRCDTCLRVCPENAVEVH